VGHRDRADLDAPVVEDHGRHRGLAGRPGRDGDVGRPDQLARVRHGRVQRHHVQVVGVTGQDVPDQVGGARGGQFRVDRGLPAEVSVTGRCLRRPARPVDVHRRHRPVRAHPDPPRVQQQASQVTGVVGVQMTEEHALQPGEVEPRVGEPRRRAAATINHEDPAGHHQRRRSRSGRAPAAAHPPCPAAPVRLPCAPYRPGSRWGMTRPSGAGSPGAG
jgi:hypothetical protein